MDILDFHGLLPLKSGISAASPFIFGFGRNFGQLRKTFGYDRPGLPYLERDIQDVGEEVWYWEKLKGAAKEDGKTVVI